MRLAALSLVLVCLTSVPGSAAAAADHGLNGGFDCARDIVRNDVVHSAAPGSLHKIQPTVARRATTINLVPGATLSANAPALAAWNAAVAHWESILSDPVSVTITGDLQALPAGVLGSTGSSLWSAGYTTIRDAMVADRAANEAITASLPTSAQFNVTLPTSPAGFSYDGNVRASRAELSALGFDMEAIDPGGTDADINFSTGFLSDFDFDPSDGITPGKIDFEAVVTHEIGHALGYSSNVDLFDYYVDQATPIASGPMAMDLYRLLPGAAAANFTGASRVLTHGGEAPAQVFYDGSAELAMSTGSYNGDGNQASHWKADEITGTTIGLMDPTLAPGQLGVLTNNDIRAVGLIGWDVTLIVDCNSNGVADATDIADGTSLDCNSNSVPDECDITSGTSLDANTNGIPDECEAVAAPQNRLGAKVLIHPNPFNPRTSVQLTLPRDSHATVKVYDLAGHFITTLTDRDYSAGEYSLIWEGQDDSGRGVSSGVYFVLVSVDGEVQRHKVALVR